MIIKITATDGGTSIALENPDDFTAFAISRGQGLTAERLSSAVARLGRPEGNGHVHVSVEALTDLAGARAENEEWRAGLEKMIAYARSKGWVDEHGGIRAHIE